MVLAVFEQKGSWEETPKNRDHKPSPKRPTKNPSSNERFILKDWLKEVEENLETTPVAGNFYGV